jgi:hypothetical protein
MGGFIFSKLKTIKATDPNVFLPSNFLPSNAKTTLTYNFLGTLMNCAIHNLIVTNRTQKKNKTTDVFFRQLIFHGECDEHNSSRLQIVQQCFLQPCWLGFLEDAGFWD